MRGMSPSSGVTTTETMGIIVPLNRPALTVGPGPRSVQQARPGSVDTIREIGRPELVETTELGVSELVTNAVLHAEPPIEVRVRGTRLHPRVEVRDGSPEPPVMPTPGRAATDPVDLDEDRLLVTFGRGLDIVARCADAWGAELEDDRQGDVVRPGRRDPRHRRRRPGHRPARRRPPHAAIRRPPVPAARASPCRASPTSSATTRSCAARSGCSHWPTSRTTRSRRPSPTCSGRCSASCARGSTSTQHPPRPDGTVDLTIRLSRRERGDDGPVRRAARLRRRVLLARADAVAGPRPRAAGLPDLVPHRVRAPAGRAARRSRGRSAPSYRAQA